MTDPLTEAQEVSEVAAHKAKSAAAAVELAREVQQKELIDRVTKDIVGERRLAEVVKEQVENVLATGSEQEKTLVLARVPFICQDIKDIHSTLVKINEALRYMPLIQILVFGLVGMIVIAVIGALISLVILQK